MSLPSETPTLDPLLEEALDWVVRLRAGEPTRDDIEALRQWRQRSAGHEDAFRLAVKIYQRGGTAAAEVAAGQNVKRVGRRSPRVLARRALMGATAAAAAGYLIARPPFGLWSSLQELSADFRTKKGERRTIEVLSGVSMDLDTETSIALRPQRDEVRIELISGQAAVAVTRPDSNPLVMLAADGRITAARANFDARCLGDAVWVTCLDGTLEVARGDQTLRLRSSEQVSYSPAKIGRSVAVDTAQVTAWQSGLLVFRDQPLIDVVDEVNRYRSGKIIILNAELKRRLVNGTFQIPKLDNFVAQVQQLFGANVTELPGGIVLLS